LIFLLRNEVGNEDTAKDPKQENLCNALYNEQDEVKDEICSNFAGSAPVDGVGYDFHDQVTDSEMLAVISLEI
jgi:hypothetical protein